MRPARERLTAPPEPATGPYSMGPNLLQKSFFDALMLKKRKGDRSTGDDVYNYAYRLQNATALIDGSLSCPREIERPLEGLLEQLRAKRVSVRRSAKYAFALKNLVKQLDVEIVQENFS